MKPAQAKQAAGTTPPSGSWVSEEENSRNCDVAAKGWTRGGLGEEDEIRSRCGPHAGPAGRRANAGIRKHESTDKTACTPRRRSRGSRGARHVDDDEHNEDNDRD